MNRDIYVNDTYLPYLKNTHKHQIYYGGSSSGKSYFLAQRTIIDNLDKGYNYLIVRNVAQTLRRSCFNEIKKAIDTLGVRDLYQINGTDMVITCKLNGKQILFAGLDDVEKLKSITPAKGVIERIWIEEATEVERAAYKQLGKRLRGMSDNPKSIILSFNPILQSHWIYKEFFQNWDDSKNQYQDEKLSILKSTYKDNHFLTPGDISELEDETDPYFHNVYTLGNWGLLGNIIFTNWRTEDLSKKISSFDNVYNGLDFGVVNPNALIRCHVDEERKKIYVFDEMYRRGQSNESLAEAVKEKIGREYVNCDCADPGSINELLSRGARAIPAKKPPNGVVFGIKWLQKFEIIIDTKCQNFKNEIQAYHWEEDKNGNAIERPVKKDDHLMDALRYATEPLQLRAKAKAFGRI